MKPSDTKLGESEELLMANTVMSSLDTQQENLRFSDNREGECLDMSTVVDYTRGDTSQSIELQNFMNRPVKIYQTTWTEGADIGPIQFYPWELYFNNPQIKKKIDNYYLLRSNLKLKLVINASPFYYGCGFLAYQPLYLFEQNWDYSTNPAYFNKTLVTQKPIVYFYPQTNAGAEMSLPWCYHQEWIDITDIDNLRGMGRCFLSNFGPLANANSVVGSNVQITIYAWAEDIELAGPTQSLALQSRDKDEYDGIISKPASAVARVAGALEEVPIIGPFATATSTVAGTIGSIASIFGFSRVPTNDPVRPMRSKTHPNCSNTDIPDVIDKLTLDSKNELSIDPKLCGVPLQDEMDITSFTSRQAYLTNALWEASDTTGHNLRTIRINPGMRNYAGVVNNAKNTYFTPMGYVAQMFKYWRGDIIVTIKVICSQYHKGRLEIVWDPNSITNTIADPSMVNYTHILDISDQTEVSIRIPYTQPTAYLETSRESYINFFSANPFAPIQGFDNGTLSVRVLNPQTSPVASANIELLFFVRGAENLEFSAPAEITELLSPYQLQSTDKVTEDVVDIGVQPSKPFKEINLVYAGETVKSFRTLFQRMSNYMLYSKAETIPTTTISNTAMEIGRMALFPGCDPNGLFIANKVNSVGTMNYNFIGWHSSTWLSLAFIGNRGSFNYTISTVDDEATSYIQASRAPDSISTAINQASLTQNENALARTFIINFSGGMQGIAITNSKTQSAITVSIPLYSKYKMLSNNPNIRTTGASFDGSDGDRYRIKIYTTHKSVPVRFPLIAMQMSTGVDFSLVFFSGIQPLYWYLTAPTAA